MAFLLMFSVWQGQAGCRYRNDPAAGLNTYTHTNTCTLITCLHLQTRTVWKQEMHRAEVSLTARRRISQCTHWSPSDLQKQQRCKQRHGFFCFHKIHAQFIHPLETNQCDSLDAEHICLRYSIKPTGLLFKHTLNLQLLQESDIARIYLHSRTSPLIIFSV